MYTTNQDYRPSRKSMSTAFQSIVFFRHKLLLSTLLIFCFQLSSSTLFAQFNYDVSRAAYAGFEERFYVGGQESNPISMKFNTTGTKMFVMGNSGDDINQYTLSTAFDVSTATYDGDAERFSVSAQEANPYSLVFNIDGTKMFVLGESSDNINQYTLSTAFDVSTAVYDGDAERFPVASQDLTPTDMAFNTSGTKLFVLGISSDYVYEYTLSAPFDVSTAIYDGDAERFRVGLQETSPFSMSFNSDGTKMFILGNSGDDINEYTLSAPFDVSTSVFDGDTERRLVTNEAPNPLSLTFNADGSKMFVMGNNTDAVHEYNLFNVAPEIDGTLAGQEVNDRSTINPYASIQIFEPNSQDVSATITLDDNAKGILSGADLAGTGPYTIASTTPELLQTILRNLIFDPTDDRVISGGSETTIFTLVISDGDLAASDNTTSVISSTDPSVTSILLSGNPDAFDTSVDFIVTFGENVTGVDVSDFTLNTSSLVTANLTGVSGSDNLYTVTVASISGDGIVSIDLNANGTGIQDGASNPIVGGFEGNIHTAGYAFDVENAAYAGINERFSVAEQEANPYEIVFNPGGTKMFVMGTSGDDINQYSLSTSFDVSTATYDGDAERFSVSTQEGNPYGLTFNNDGTKMFVIGDNDNVNQYTLSVAYDVSTAIYDGDAERFSVTFQETSPTDLLFNPDGTKMFVLGNAGNDINQYTLSSPFDVSTAAYDGDTERFSVGGQESTPNSMVFNPDGTKMYIMGSSGDDINSYSLSTAYDISTAIFDGNEERLYINSFESNPYGLAFNSDGTRMFVVGGTNDVIQEFTLFDIVPEINGAVANQQVNDRTTIAPFGGILITEGNNQAVTATITLDDNAKGILSGADLTGTGPYTVASATPALLQETIRNLIFDPTDDRVTSGATETTTFTLAVSDGNLIANNNTTTVIVTTEPSVISIVVSGDPGAFDTSVDFIVTFEENVTGVNGSDFTLNNSERVTASLTGVSGSDNVYTVTVASISGDGIISIDLNASGTGIQDGSGNPATGGFEGNIHEVGFAFDIANAAYAGVEETFNVRNQEGTPTSLVFNPDGTKMFIIGSSGDNINQYSLSSAYDVSTAIYDGDEERLSVGEQESTAYGLAFDNTGIKMFVIGENGDNVNQYTLSTAYDVSTAIYDGDIERFSVAFQETSPTDLAFNPDGTKMFVLGASGNDISQYTLASPFDVSTAVYDGDAERFSVSGQEGTPFSFVFNPDGAKIFVMGSNGDDINSYTLSTAYDVSTAVFDGEEERLSVNSFDTSPFGLAFSPDGTKMFVVGASTDVIYEFNLFDVAPEIDGTVADQEVNDQSTIAPFADILITEGNNQAVTATITLDDNAKGILSGADLTGTGPYTVAATTSDLLQTILRGLIFDPTDDRVSSGSTETTTFTLEVNDGNFIANDNSTTVVVNTEPSVVSIVVSGDPGAFDTSVDFIVTFEENVTGVNGSDFTLNNSERVTANLTGVSGSDNVYTVTVASISGDGIISIDLNASGTGIQDGSGNPATGGFEGNIHEVGFAFDIANAAYAGVEETFNVRNQEGTPTSLVFNPDGTKMFIIGSSGDNINQYSLSSAYDVSTATYDGDEERLSVREQESNAYGLAFDNTGIKMFVIGESGDNVNQYTLSTAYDVSTAIYDGDIERFSVAAQETSPTDLAFNPDGTKMFVLGASGNDISQYTLASPFDVSTAVYDGDAERFSVSGQEGTPFSFVFNPDGAKIFVMGSNGDDINSYTLSTAYDVSTAVFDGEEERLPVNSFDTSPFGLAFSPDGTKMFVVGASTDAIYEFNLFDIAPEIDGTVADQEVNDRSTIAPFADILITEGNNQAVTATITLDDNAKGVLSGADLTGTGPYTVAATTSDLLQTILRNLIFDPTDDRVSSGSTETTTFTLAISDGNLIANNTETTVITSTDPNVESIVLVGDPGRFDTTIDFIVTFGENVTGVNVSDFTLNTSEFITASLSGVSGSDNLYTVTVASISGDGIISINLNESGTGIQDGAGNQVIGGFESRDYHIAGFAYDIANAVYLGVEEGLNVGNQEGNPHDLVFTPDGLKMFLLGSSGDDINQYNLSSAYDVSTAVFDATGTFSVRAQESNPYGLAFNNDGTKMFIVGETSDFISQYTLSVPYDVLSATFDGDSERFSVAGQEASPSDLAFNHDGTKLFVLGFSSDVINQYTLTSPYDVSTSVFDGVDERFFVNGQESTPRSFTFSIDGMEVFVMGNSGDDINSYTLASAYDISTAVFNGNDERFSVNLQDPSPYGLTFKPDGTKMFVVGASTDFVYEYVLKDVAPEIEGVLVGQEVNDRSSVNPFADIIIIEGNNQNVSATITLDNNAKGILSGDDLTGSGPYAIAAATATEMQDILRSIAFNPTDDRVTSGFPEITRFTLVINDGTFTTSNNSTTTITTTDPKVSNIVLANSPDQFDTTVDFIVTFGEDVTGVDISDFILNSSENVSSSLAGINGSGNEYIITVESISGDGVIDIDLLTTGTDIQDGGGNSIIGGFNAGEYHYSGYSYDVSNAIYAGIDEGLFVGSQESTPTSIQFNTDGTKMFLIGSSGDEVNQYRLASAYDISTAVYDNITFSLRSQDRTTYGLVFNPEGTKMFVLGATGDNVYQYSVATPFDMSTVTYDGNGELFSCSPQESDPRDLRFSNDGLKLFILGRTFIHSYTLDSPYDVSTALYDGVGERFAVNSQEGSPFSLNFNLDGTKLYILGNSNRQVISYTLAEAFDVSTATFDGNDERLNVNGQASNSLGLTFKPDGTKMYVMDNSSNYIYEYDLANIVPELVNPIVRIEAFEDDNFNFEVPENTFRDLNLSTELRYEASLESGGGLPGWLTYDDISNTFSGTPTNDDVATFSVELTAFDDLGTSAIDIFELEVVNVNDVPTLTPIADQITNEGQVVSFSTSVSDVDVGDTFTWTVDQLSRNKGVTVFNSGEVSWKPGEDYDGLNDVTVTVTDAGGLSASQSLTITVNEVNNAPTISRIGDKEVVESNTLAFTVIARDRDPVEQIIAYSIDASSTGKGMSIDAATGAFSWTVDNQDVGFHDVTVEVTDGDLTASEIFTIRVREENIAPVLTTIGNRTVNAFTPLSFTVTATDANADESFIFSLETTSSLPNSISFNEITGEFNWTPRQVGTYEITISVSDGIASDSEAFTIEVQEPLSTELETKQEVTIFPNPVQRDLQININGPDMGWLSIQLYNLNGQVVLERNVQKTEQLIELTLDITGLNSGVYVLKTKVGSTESTPVNVIKVD